MEQASVVGQSPGLKQSNDGKWWIIELSGFVQVTKYI